MRNKLYALLKKKILEWVAIPSPGDLPDPEIEPMSPTLQADSPPELPGKPQHVFSYTHKYPPNLVCPTFWNLNR